MCNLTFFPFSGSICQLGFIACSLCKEWGKELCVVLASMLVQTALFIVVPGLLVYADLF